MTLVDIPMGEFWYNSPTHDKPNDMLDAVSGAHIYGKPIVQAEAFTTLRMAWDEHPGNLKALGDWAYCMGVNKLVYHVLTHNPWMDRKPGMTLDGVGINFQRDQTWWKPGRAWVEYATRCQALLQQGQHVADIAVFTGEETPRRAILPYRLVETLPGIFGQETVEKEKKRLANVGVPEREIPDGVKHSANMADRGDWIDPLKGYSYDSFNKDALLGLAKVKNGRIVLPGGASYGILIIPGSRKMNPHGNLMTPEVAQKLYQLAQDGATILFAERPDRSPSLVNIETCDKTLHKIINKLWNSEDEIINDLSGKKILTRKSGKGRILEGPYALSSFNILGIDKDFIATDTTGQKMPGIAWTHRAGKDFHLYFVSNQYEGERIVNLSLRAYGFKAEIYDPVTGEIGEAGDWEIENNRTNLSVKLSSNGSVFIVLQKPANTKESVSGKNISYLCQSTFLDGPWHVSFNPEYGGPKDEVVFDSLTGWNMHADPSIMYYSGTATYHKQFVWIDDSLKSRVWLQLGEVANIAEVWINDKNCGIAWTYPYQVDITNALKAGINSLNIEVTNTWANRIIGDQYLPADKRIVNTTAPFRLGGKPLLKAGLLGPLYVLF